MGVDEPCFVKQGNSSDKLAFAAEEISDELRKMKN